MTTYREAAEAIVADDDPASGIVRIARYALDGNAPTASESVTVAHRAHDVLRNPAAPDQHQDAAVLALANATDQLFPYTEGNLRDAPAVAERVLADPGAPREARRLAETAVAAESPDHRTGREVAEIAARVLNRRVGGPGGDVDVISGMQTTEVEALTLAAMARCARE